MNLTAIMREIEIESEEVGGGIERVNVRFRD